MPDSAKASKKINFFHLFKVFRFKVIVHFLITTFKTLIYTILFSTIIELFFQKEMIEDYRKLFPELLQNLINNPLSKKGFVVWGLSVVIVYAIIYYFDNLLEDELMARSGRYTRERLINKFRNLPFEERQIRQQEANNLITIESSSVAWFWEHLYNHIYHSILSIIFLLIVNWNKVEKMSKSGQGLTLIWLGLFGLLIYLFARWVFRDEKKWKIAIEKENSVVNKEVNKSILIDSMGLLPEYKRRQQKIMDKNLKARLSFDHVNSLSKVIPTSLGYLIFPFLLLTISKDFVGESLAIAWDAFDNVKEISVCLWDYGDYSSSLSRINKFLQLPEKDDNLAGLKLNPKEKIKSISYQNVSFHYANSNDLVIENYSHDFTKKNINKLLGENGTGKSTLLYLLLGMLKPIEGEIFIHCEDGKTYNLNKEINLQHWREKKVAYFSHDNLVEQGSTGQKQIASINEILATKKEVEIIILDEATNALDKENQAKVQDELEKLLKKGKIIIYTKH